MAKRKTIQISEIIDIVNQRNMNSTCDKKVREGWNSLLNAVLHRTGNYHGFRCLGKDEVPEGEKPGIARSLFDDANWFPDETRIHFFKERTFNRF